MNNKSFRSALLNGCYVRIIVSLLTLLLPAYSLAISLVMEIKGEPDSVTILRSGEAIHPEILSILKDNDQLVVESAETQVVILLDDNTEKVINVSNSPFLVKTISKEKTFIDNLLEKALPSWSSFAGNEAKAHSMISRGDGIDPVTISGVNNEENYLAGWKDSVFIAWTGGKPPYKVSIYQNGETVYDVETQATEVKVPAHFFNEDSEYVYEVSHVEDGHKKGAELLIETYNHESLPGDILRILRSELPEKIKLRIASMELAKIPGWRFQALQLAVTNGFDELSDRYLLGLYPEN